MTQDNNDPLTAEERAAIDRGLADARAGRLAASPVAWGVLRIGGRMMAILDDVEQAEALREKLDRMENWPHEIVPLYTSPALTDDERDAVETAALEADAHQHTERAATLRGLLERQVFLQKNLTDRQRRHELETWVKNEGFATGYEP